jgi:hypothetical protein
MSMLTVKRRPLLVVTVSLILAILLDRFLIVPFFPFVSGGLGIDLMPVFLDIPVHLPFVIDIIPVTILFFLIYSVWLKKTGNPVKKMRWAVFSGFLLLFICMLVGAALFYMMQDHLSRQVSNGINSIGIQADLYLPFPDGNVVHLRGSMILLVCCWIGSRPLVSSLHSLRPALLHQPETSATGAPSQTSAVEVPPQTPLQTPLQTPPQIQPRPKVCYPEPMPRFALQTTKKKEADLV